MTSSSTDPALDFSHESLTPDPLDAAYRPTPGSRRDPATSPTQAWLTTELASLLVAFGLAPLGASYSGRVRNLAAPYVQLGGVPKLVAWKAGLRVQKGTGEKAAERDAVLAARRDQVLASWRADHARFSGLAPPHHPGVPYGVRPIYTLIPYEILPLLDRTAPNRLASTPTALGRDRDGRLVVIRAHASHDVEAQPRWHRIVELEGDMLVTSAARGLVVIGERWAADYVAEPGPIRTTEIAAPSAQRAAMLRVVAMQAWSLVHRLREIGPGHVRIARDIWESCRAAVRGDWAGDAAAGTGDTATQDAIASAVEGIDDIDQMVARQVT